MVVFIAMFADSDKSVCGRILCPVGFVFECGVWLEVVFRHRHVFEVGFAFWTLQSFGSGHIPNSDTEEPDSVSDMTVTKCSCCLKEYPFSQLCTLQNMKPTWKTFSTRKTDSIHVWCPYSSSNKLSIWLAELHVRICKHCDENCQIEVINPCS